MYSFGFIEAITQFDPSIMRGSLYNVYENLHIYICIYVIYEKIIATLQISFKTCHWYPLI